MVLTATGLQKWTIEDGDTYRQIYEADITDIARLDTYRQIYEADITDIAG